MSYKELFKTFLNVFEKSSRCLQDVFKKFSRRTDDKLVLLTHLQDIFNASSRRLQDVSRKENFNKFLRRTVKMITYRKIDLDHTSSGIYYHDTNFLRINLFNVPKISELFFGIPFVTIAFTNSYTLVKLGYQKTYRCLS